MTSASMSTVKNRKYKRETKSASNGTFKGEEKHNSDDKIGNFVKAVLEWDEKYTRMCAVCSDKSSMFRPLMKLIEISCHGIPWLLVTAVLILSVHQAHHIEILVNLFYGLVIDLISIGISKAVFRRSRPQHNEMDMFATVSIDRYSFPSGHASRAGMLACFFVLCVLDSALSITSTLLWSFVVTFSRVLLGRHHLVDVICGYVLGIFEYLLLRYVWISRETSMSWLELYFSHFHL